MHRPLRIPFHLRVWHLIRGLLFYSTVYWRRASDGLNMPTLSAEERERQRPERNLEIIRPRMHPRARIDTAHEPVVGDVTAGAEVSEPVYGPVVSEPAAPPPRVIHQQESPGEGEQTVYVKRRRYRRHLSARGSSIDRGGFFARVFRR